MPVNIEIKARLDDIEDVKDRIEDLTHSKPELLRQRDVFYKTTNGRLKLRQFHEGTAELIYYERSDDAAASSSIYHRVQIPHPAETHEILKNAMAVRGTIEKIRMLYLIGQTRIHLDQVNHLGDFIELEVVLKAGQSEQEGIQTAEYLCEKLGINEKNLIDVAYIDLLEARQANH